MTFCFEQGLITSLLNSLSVHVWSIRCFLTLNALVWKQVLFSNSVQFGSKCILYKVVVIEIQWWTNKQETILRLIYVAFIFLNSLKFPLCHPSPLREGREDSKITKYSQEIIFLNGTLKWFFFVKILNQTVISLIHRKTRNHQFMQNVRRNESFQTFSAFNLTL